MIYRAFIETHDSEPKGCIISNYIATTHTTKAIQIRNSGNQSPPLVLMPSGFYGGFDVFIWTGRESV